MRNDDVHEIRLVFTHEVKNIKGKNTEQQENLCFSKYVPESPDSLH